MSPGSREVIFFGFEILLKAFVFLRTLLLSFARPNLLPLTLQSTSFAPAPCLYAAVTKGLQQ